MSSTYMNLQIYAVFMSDIKVVSYVVSHSLASVSELQAQILQMARSGIKETGTAAVLATEQQVLSVTLSSGTQTAGIKKNMRRAFGE